MNNRISAIILTYNEEKHIARCINSVQTICSEIFVIDSFSSDNTCSIAKELGAKVYQHPFEYQAKQFNWAIENCPVTSEWIWRIDADEYVEKSLSEKILRTLKDIPKEVNGIYVNRKIIFMGKALLHGGWYPAPQIKIIRKGYGACEDKRMDEHLIIFSGKAIHIDGNQVDENMNDLSWWTQKHNNYSGREAINMLLTQYGMDNKSKEVIPKLFGTAAERKRWLKLKYMKMPLFIRPFANFFVRYILKGGFLDGKEGFIWHILQGFWYRMLVDAKIYEIKKRFGFSDEKIQEFIKANYPKQNT